MSFDNGQQIAQGGGERFVQFANRQKKDVYYKKIKFNKLISKANI